MRSSEAAEWFFGVGANCGADLVNALSSQYTVRFGVVEDCVDKYLDKCGRGWVGMGSIFSFALAAPRA